MGRKGWAQGGHLLGGVSFIVLPPLCRVTLRPLRTRTMRPMGLWTDPLHDNNIPSLPYPHIATPSRSHSKDLYRLWNIRINWKVGFLFICGDFGPNQPVRDGTMACWEVFLIDNVDFFDLIKLIYLENKEICIKVFQISRCIEWKFDFFLYCEAFRFLITRWYNPPSRMTIDLFLNCNPIEGAHYSDLGLWSISQKAERGMAVYLDGFFCLFVEEEGFIAHDFSDIENLILAPYLTSLLFIHYTHFYISDCV